MTHKPWKSPIAALTVLGVLAVGGAANADADNGLNAWTEGANSAIDDVMSFPAIAAQRGLSGRSVFTVTVDRDGDVVDSKLVSNSGARMLKSAARRVLKNAEFPALPRDYEGEELHFSLRLNYITTSNPLEVRALQRGTRVSSEEVSSGTPVASRITILSVSD